MRYKKYESHKDSGIDWIGEIPEHWEVKTLKRLISKLESGGRETGGANIDDGIWSLGGEHISWDGKLLLDNPKFISEEFYNQMKKGKIENDDILLVKDGATIGKCAFIDKKPFNEMAINEHLYKIRANKFVLPKYLYYLIISNIGFEQITLSIRGSAQGGINSGFVENVYLPICPLKEQKYIVSFLDEKTFEINSLIEDKEKLITLLEEKRQAIITEAVTKGLNINAKMKDSGIDWIGEIPEHWEVKTLKRLISKLESGGRETGGANIDDGIWSLGGEHISWDGKLLLDNPKFISEEFYNQMKKGKIENDDILLVKDGATIGKCAFIDKKPFNEMAINEHLYKIRANKFVLPKYLYYLIISNIGFEQITLSIRGSAQGGINSGFVENVYLPICPLKEQKYIVSFLDEKTFEIDLIINYISKQIQKLNEYRQSLIFEAITGKIDLRDLVS